MPDSLFGFNWLGFNKSAQIKLSPDPTHPVNYGRRRSDRPVTIAQVKKLYDRPPSFTNQLPWLEFDHKHQVVLLAQSV